MQKIETKKEEIASLEEKLKSNKDLQTHIINYAKSGGKDTAAKKAFSKYKRGELPKMKELRAEHEALWQQKKETYSKYLGDKKELREDLIAKENLELMMGLKDTAIRSQPQAVL